MITKIVPIQVSVMIEMEINEALHLIDIVDKSVTETSSGAHQKIQEKMMDLRKKINDHQHTVY